MSSNGNVHTVTDADFESQVKQSDTLTLVDFWADWCGPCKMIAPTVEELAEEYQGRLKVFKLDVDENQRTAMRFNVRSIPSILFFKDGKVVDTTVGAMPKNAIEAKIKQHLG